MKAKTGIAIIVGVATACGASVVIIHDHANYTHNRMVELRLKRTRYESMAQEEGMSPQMAANEAERHAWTTYEKEEYDRLSR